MPTRDEVLQKQTFKEDHMELEQRVFYTLINHKNGEIIHFDEKDIQIHRIIKAVAFIMKLLKERDLLNDDEIDELLLDAIN